MPRPIAALSARLLARLPARSVLSSPLSVACASILAFAALAGVAGCEASPPAVAEGRPPATAATGDPLAGDPAGNPLVGIQRADGAALAGVVAEVLPTGGYTYFRLTDGGWAVVMGPGPAVGQRVEARVFARKADFRSRRLDRTFAELAFVDLSPAAGG